MALLDNSDQSEEEDGNEDVMQFGEGPCIPLRSDVNSRDSVSSQNVDVLRALCTTYVHWGSIEDTEDRYGACRTKAYEIRGAVQKLYDNEIDGVSWEELEESFGDQDLMNSQRHVNMPLQKCKISRSCLTKHQASGLSSFSQQKLESEQP